MNDPQDQEGPSELGEKEQKHLLEDFVVGNPDLARLETELAQFNLFEAIGVVRSEVRHSDFLAYLGISKNLEERKRLLRASLEAAYIENSAITAFKPRPEFYNLIYRSGGPDGIRTRDLCLDRAAC